MDYLDTLLLHGIARLEGERTLTGLYYLLSGKKSSQTVQDGKLFGLSHLFGTMSNMKLTEFESRTQSFLMQGWITLGQDGLALLTTLGRSMLVHKLDTFSIPDSLDGWTYGDLCKVFWRRLTLFVQTLAFFLEGDRRFYPIQNEPDVQSWVRNQFPKDNEARQQKATSLYHELLTLLNEMDDVDAKNFILRLTRPGRVGKTSRQVAEQLKLDPIEADVRFLGVLHFIMKQVWNNPRKYPALYPFIADRQQTYTLTDSTRKTLSYLQKGKSIAEVAMYRKLKTSTIEDHVVEVAIYVPSFVIDSYIDKQGQQEIFSAAKQYQTKRLKAIKKYLQNDYSYFQIRLTLAKWTNNT